MLKIHPNWTFFQLMAWVIGLSHWLLVNCFICYNATSKLHRKKFNQISSLRMQFKAGKLSTIKTKATLWIELYLSVWMGLEFAAHWLWTHIELEQKKWKWMRSIVWQMRKEFQNPINHMHEWDCWNPSKNQKLFSLRFCSHYVCFG